MATIGEMAAAFAELEKRKTAYEVGIKECEKRMEALSGPLAQEMLRHGMPSIVCNGMRIDFGVKREVHRVAQSKGVTQESLAQALRDFGYGEQCSVSLWYNPSSLAKVVKDAVSKYRAKIGDHTGLKRVSLEDAGIPPEVASQCYLVERPRVTANVSHKEMKVT